MIVAVARISERRPISEGQGGGCDFAAPRVLVTDIRYAETQCGAIKTTSAFQRKNSDNQLTSVSNSGPKLQIVKLTLLLFIPNLRYVGVGQIERPDQRFLDGRSDAKHCSSQINCKVAA
jgi:hypothetical protein